MNPHFRAFVELGIRLAEEKGLSWQSALDAHGKSLRNQEWNLTAIIDDIPPVFYLRDFGVDAKALPYINARREQQGQSPLPCQPISLAWQDLIKSAALEQLLVRKNTTSHVAQNVIRPLRVIATSAWGKEPWELIADDFNDAARIGSQLQASGKLGDLIIGLANSFFDSLHLLNVGPVYPVLSRHRDNPNKTRRAKFLKSESELRQDLEDRKRQERLPERKAFWELIRIVMTEVPASFMDELRFAALRLAIITGFRVGEAVLLPTDWRRQRTYFDAEGRPAGAVGGYSSALMIRHFAEKQQSENSDSRILIEGTQYVPEMFVEIIEETLVRVAEITAPLRRTLKLQVETNRYLPEYALSDLVPAETLYTHLTGNPFWTTLGETPFWDESVSALTRQWHAQLKSNPSVDNFDALFNQQRDNYLNGTWPLSMAAYQYFRRLGIFMSDPLKNKNGFYFRSKNGEAISSSSQAWWPKSGRYFRISELEQYLKENIKSKAPDLHPLHLANKDIHPHELLFIHPKRSLAEERNGGLTDISRYISVGYADPDLIGLALGDVNSRETIFSRYGRTTEDKSLYLRSHMLRHLQNTELFRLGVADTIITKRFNRKSVTQSYEYDHRSLAEELDQLELPFEAEMELGEKAATVARMIKAGKANGPIVDAFRRIQTLEGDSAAFEYLKVEADGFHATPYGHCLNSFTVDPCPKHLECFAGCRHLSATNLPENRAHLIRLEGKLAAALDAVESRQSKSVGHTNQVEHARVRLQGVRRLLETNAGERVFPDGEDFSKPRAKGLLDA